jgi:hypothetical protein
VVPELGQLEASMTGPSFIPAAQPLDHVLDLRGVWFGDW